jgi:hypothetical protein
MDVEREIKDLKRRVGDLEGAVNVLAGQLGQIHPDLVELKDLSAARFDIIDGAMGRFINRLDTVNAQVWSLRDDLPDLLSAAVSQVLPRSGN